MKDLPIPYIPDPSIPKAQREKKKKRESFSPYTPRRFNKYNPHQGERECLRRIMQAKKADEKLKENA